MNRELDVGAGSFGHIQPLDRFLDRRDVFGKVTDRQRFERLLDRNCRAFESAAEGTNHLKQAVWIAVLDLKDLSLEPLFLNIVGTLGRRRRLRSWSSRLLSERRRGKA